MSVVVAEGVVEVTADGKGVPGQLRRDIEGNASQVEAAGATMGGGLSNGIKTGLGMAGKVVAGALIAATAAVGIGVGALVTNGVAFQSEMQNYTASFTPLLGGADKAKAKLEELSAMGASTPFQLTDLASASQTLLSFGEDANNLMPDLKMLGDISQGNAEKFAGLSLVFGQVQSTGRLMGEDVNQMINQGFNPLVEISKMTGESMVDLKARMEDGAISFEEVKGAMAHATAEGGMFFNAMELGSQTLTGAWSSTQDGANILSGAIVGDLTPSLTDLLSGGINPLLGGLVDLVNGVDGAGAVVDDAAGTIIGSIQNLSTPLVSLAGNLGTVFTALAPAIGAALTAIVDSLVTVLPSLITLAGGLITGLVTAIAGNAPQLVETAVPVILGFVTGLVGMLPMLIQTGVDVLIALMSGITESLPTLIPSVVESVIGAITTLFAPGNLTALLDAGLQLLMGLVTGILAALPTLIAALPGIIVGIVGFLVGAIPTLIDAGLQLFLSLVGALPQIVTAIVAAIPQIIVGLISAIIGAQPQMMMAGIKLIMALVTNLPTIIYSLSTMMPQIVMGLITAITSSGMVGKMASAGGDLIRGLWNGIKDLGGWLMDKVRGFMDGFVGGIKAFFGIKSPSRLFRDEIGAQLGAGMAAGIMGSAGLVAAAASGLGDAAMGELGGIGIDVNGRVATNSAGISASSSPTASSLANSTAGGSDAWNAVMSLLAALLEAVKNIPGAQINLEQNFPDSEGGILRARQTAREIAEYLGV